MPKTQKLCTVCLKPGFQHNSSNTTMCVKCKNSFYFYWKKLSVALKKLKHDEADIEKYTKICIDFLRVTCCKSGRNDLLKLSFSEMIHNSLKPCQQLCAVCRFKAWFFIRVEWLPKAHHSRMLRSIFLRIRRR